jgi:hypothetical protein
LSQTTFQKSCAKQPLIKVEPNNFSKKLCKTTFDKGCAKQQHFWFYLFLKGKEKGLKINNLLL